MSSKPYLPLFHALEGKPCLVLGAGNVALRKTRRLLRFGLQVRVVAPAVLPQFKDLAQAQLTVQQQVYSEAVLGEAPWVFVIAATDDPATNARIAADCRSRNVPVNVVDNPDLCDFIFPTTVERSPLSIAITAGGKSPILSRVLKNLIQALVPASYGQLAKLVGDYRMTVKQALPDEKQRIQFWEQVLQGTIAEAVFSGKPQAAEKQLNEALAQPEAFLKAGEVYLIGAGPGDPGLLTLRAFRLLQQADVVLYDRLVSEDIMAMLRPETEKIYVGKRRADHAVPQQEINQLLVEHAKQGKRVARLKGGDPFIFGRGGEEIETLSAHGVPFQVIPGITAASGCAAYAGIPLTHRDHAQSVRFVTGQLKDGSVDLPWQQLVDKQQTVVFYMGLNGLPEICQQLIAHGADAALPAALVEKGTTYEQRIHVDALQGLPAKVAGLEVRSPSLLIVGSVVSLSEKLAWFDPA